MCTLGLFSCVQLFVTIWTIVPTYFPVLGILQARITKWAAMHSSRIIKNNWYLLRLYLYAIQKNTK